MQDTCLTRAVCMSSTPLDSPFVLSSPSAGLCPVPVVTGVASLAQPSQLPSGLLPPSAPSQHFQLASVPLLPGDVEDFRTWRAGMTLDFSS